VKARCKVSVYVGLETGALPERPNTIPRPVRCLTHCPLNIASSTPRTLKPYDQFLTILFFQIRRSYFIFLYF